MEILPSHFSCGVQTIRNLATSYKQLIPANGNGMTQEEYREYVYINYEILLEENNRAEYIVRKIRQVYAKTPNIFMFSDADNYKNGIGLANYIKQNKLYPENGLVEIGPFHNYSSNHRIRAWYWRYEPNIVENFYMDKKFTPKVMDGYTYWDMLRKSEEWYAKYCGRTL